MNYIEKFRTETGLISKLGEGNAYLCWVMALYLDRNDVIGLATDDLTDGKNDKKIDFVDLDIGNGKITLAQGYYSMKDRDEAPANKASDMNAAIAWLLSGNISEIPDYMREIISECREAINNNEITIIDAVYVHNLVTMINEEDHFRIQSFKSGLDIESAYNNIIQMDKNISEKIEYAFRFI